MEKEFKIVNVIIKTDENENVCIFKNESVEQLKDWYGTYGASKFIEFIEENVYLENSMNNSLYFNNSYHGSDDIWDGYWFSSMKYKYIEVFFRSVNTVEKETYTEEQIELEITLHRK